MLTEFTCFVLVGTLDIFLIRENNLDIINITCSPPSRWSFFDSCVRCNSISVWRSIPAHRVAISLHVYRAVNFLSISLHSGADSRIVREAIKTRLHEWNVGSIDCSAACCMRARVIACSQVEVDVLGSIERVISGESIKRGIVGSLRAARATRNSIQDERNGD